MGLVATAPTEFPRGMVKSLKPMGLGEAGLLHFLHIGDDPSYLEAALPVEAMGLNILLTIKV